MSGRSAYILVGGKSSRYGSDKALLEVEGRPLVLRLAEVARQAAGHVALVGPAERYQHLGLPVVADSHPGCGPLSGILAALEHSSEPWNLLLACDMPSLDPAFLDFLFTVAAQGKHDVVLPVSPAGRDEPLCAVYAKTASATLRREIDNGARKITRALESLAVRRLLPEEYRHLDPAGKTFTNVNTPADWEKQKRAP